MTTPPLCAAEGALADAYTDLEFARREAEIDADRAVALALDMEREWI